MQISFKHQAIEKKTSDACIITQPCIEDKTINFVRAKITGRYPNVNYVTNQICKEIVYVNEGNGKLVVDGKEYLISEGDTVLIDPGEKYYWEGNMSLFICCSPAWTVEQHTIVA